jgi:site-specific DNA-methyltransferase (adenine-specific)
MPKLKRPSNDYGSYSSSELCLSLQNNSFRNFGKRALDGTFNINCINSNLDAPSLFYDHPNGEIWIGDATAWLKTLENESVDLIFADPPYNINKAEWDSFESQEDYIKWSLLWLKEASRVLKSNGTLYICGFSEILADIKHPALKHFEGCRWLIWHYKNKANLGSDWGRSHECILHFRKSRRFTFNIDNIRLPYSNHTLKYPTHPQAETSQYGDKKNGGRLWTPNPLGAKPKDVIEIPTTCNGMNEKTPHPTQKPEELLRKFILVSSNPGDIVIDPFLGSGTTAVVSEQLGRKWKGCDISMEYSFWAAKRIELVQRKSVQEWIQFDAKYTERRKSIR